MQRLRIGVVGAGFISRTYHCPSLRQLARKYPGLELAAICDINLERARSLAGEFGFSAHYGDTGQLLEHENLDGAYILTLPETIKEIALKFLDRRIPLLLEKPPGINSGQVRELARAASKAGVHCLVALNRRFMPLVRNFKEHLDSLGRPPQFLHAQILRYNRCEKEFAYGTAVHAIDLMRYLGGDAAGIKVSRYSPAGNKAFSYQVEFKFKSGLQGYLSILPEAGFEAERYAMHGNGFSLLLEAPLEWTLDYPGRLLLFEGRQRHLAVDNRVWPESMRDRLDITGFLGESDHFLDCLVNGRTPMPSLEDCLQSIQIAEAVQAGEDRTFD